MSNQNKFRERVDKEGDGLVYDESIKPFRPSISGLEIDTSIDLSKIEKFGTQQVDLMGAASKMMPQGTTGLQLDADMNKLDEGVRRIQAQQANQKIRSLLDDAQKKISQQNYSDALKDINKALELDPNSADIYFLKGHCLRLMDNFEAALESLKQAQQLARNPELFILILFLQAFCLRSAAEKAASEIQVLVGEGRLSEAFALADSHLRRQPGNPAFHYHRSGILLLMGRLSDAEISVRHALQQFGNDNSEMFMDLLNSIQMKKHGERLDKARVALRKGSHKDALQILESCQPDMQGMQMFDAIYSYAYERGGGGFANLFKRNKPKVLSSPERQKFLQWLLAEELNGGMEALNQKDYLAAIKMLSVAVKIDERCGAACFLLSLSYVRDLEASLEMKRYDLDELISRFQEASRLITGAFFDADIAPQAQGLRKMIGGYLDQLNEVVRQQERAKREAQPINKLVENFNNLMENLKKQGIRSPKDLDNFERQFHSIRDEAERLRKGRSLEQGGKVLADIIQIVDGHLGQISGARAQAKGSQKVGECVEAFNTMMSYYQKSPISNYSQAQEAKRKIHDIQSKVSDARRHNPGSDGVQVLDKLDDALRNVLQQLG